MQRAHTVAAAATALATATARRQEILTVNEKPWLLQSQNQTVHLTPIKLPSNPVTHTANNRLLSIDAADTTVDYDTEKVPELVLMVHEPIDVKVVFCPRNCDDDHDHQYGKCQDLEIRIQSTNAYLNTLDPADNYKSNCTGNCLKPAAHHSVDLSWKPVKLSDTASFQTIT